MIQRRVARTVPWTYLFMARCNLLIILYFSYTATLEDLKEVLFIYLETY